MEARRKIRMDRRQEGIGRIVEGCKVGWRSRKADIEIECFG